MRSFAGAVCALLLASPAQAQVRPGSFEAGAMFGFMEGDDLYENGLVFGGRVAYNLNRVLGFETRYSVSPTTKRTPSFSESGAILETRTEDVTIGQLGFNALINLNSAMVNPYLAGGVGMVFLEGTHFAANFGIGTRVHITEEFFAKADVRGWFSADAPASDQYAHFHATVGFGVQLGGDYDMDDDGIPNVQDRCPTSAEDKDDFEDSDGCPEDDNDKDGVKDADDKCPLKAEDKDGDQDEDGCPDVDDDNDGVGNEADKCKDVPEDKDGFEDEDGCPDKDNDKDGLEDAVDLCPDAAETKNNWGDGDGCPEKDTDGDAIFDIVDKCADKPETLNGYNDLDGCPDEVPADVTAVLGIIPDVQFERKSEAIFKRSLKSLDALAETVKRYPQVVFEIHATAHSGDDPQGLSNLRAAGVWTYLTSKGIGEQAIRAKGIGAAPLPANAPKGAKKNKGRAELHLYVPAKQPQPEAPPLEELKALQKAGGKAKSGLQERIEKRKKAAAEKAAEAPAADSKPDAEKATK